MKDDSLHKNYSARDRRAHGGLNIITISSWQSQYYPKPTGEIKRLVRKRDNYTYQLCGKPNSKYVDHIIPLVIRHDSSLDNLRVLCSQCNADTRQKRCDSRLPLAEWFRLIEEELKCPQEYSGHRR